MSNIKLKVIKESIKRINKRLQKIDEFLTAKPVGRICEIRREAQNIIENNRGDHVNVIIMLKPLAAEERKMIALAKKQLGKSSLNFSNEKVDLMMQLQELNRELYYLEKRL